MAALIVCTSLAITMVVLTWLAFRVDAMVFDEESAPTAATALSIVAVAVVAHIADLAVMAPLRCGRRPGPGEPARRRADLSRIPNQPK